MALGKIPQKQDLTTTEGLYKTAVDFGFQSDADRILKQNAGEETKKIFSGGFISDIFDTLNVLQYGVVGIMKGKSFMEGVKTRQSFSDKDALGDKGIPGTIAGILLDIAVDPLTYIAPTTILKKIPGLSQFAKTAKGKMFGELVETTIKTGKGIKKIKKLEGGTQIGKWFGDKFVWMFGADPIFKETYQKSIKNIAQGTQNFAEMAKNVSKLDVNTAAKIITRDKTGRFGRTALNKLRNILNPEEFNNVSKFYKTLDDLGQEAVNLKMLSKETFEKNFGEYLKSAFIEYEKVKGPGLFAFKKLGIKGIKQRVKDLSPEQMKKLGQIDNPAYLLFKSTFDLNKDIQNAKLFSKVNKFLGSDIMQGGFKKLPSGKRLGELADRYVPESVFNYIQEIAQPISDNIGKKLVAAFKFNKVLLNPSTHARNIVSNTMLNWWKLGVGPWRLDLYAEATQQAFKGGKWVDEIESVSGFVDTFVANEIRGTLDSPEVSSLFKGTKGLWKKAKSKIGNIYETEEKIAKIAAFIAQRKVGLSIEDAWKAAESATFNYAQVTPFIRKLRTSIWGFPFITFTVKATPIAIETALKAPHRISALGKIKNAIEQASDIKITDRERASEPPWIKDGFYIKLPIKDKHGRSAYFDLTYIIPFGDLMSGSFFQRQIRRETGLSESITTAALSKSPTFNVIKEISRNQDFFGDKIWNESDTIDIQTKDLMRHLTKTLMPPLISDQIPGGYTSKGTRRQKGFIGALTPQDKANQQRTLMQEMLRNVGAKIQPVDVDIQEQIQKWNTNKGLQTLLREQGVISEFKRPFILKKKD